MIGAKDSRFRAMEDPLTSLFDLADRLSHIAPWILTRIRITLIFILFSLFFTVLILILGITTANVILVLIFSGFLIAGIMSLHMVLKTRQLFRYFALRHAAISAVREEPVSKIPPGKTPAIRFLNYLRSKNPRFRSLMDRQPQIVRLPGELRGRSGREYRFDACVLVTPGWLSRIFVRPYLLLIKVLPAYPTVEDLRSLQRTVSDISAALHTLPSRVVLIVSGTETGEVSDEVYRRVMDGLEIAFGSKMRRVLLQIVIESPDGTYDFIPIVLEIAGLLP
jgi:hypothetical protein